MILRNWPKVWSCTCYCITSAKTMPLITYNMLVISTLSVHPHAIPRLATWTMTKGCVRSSCQQFPGILSGTWSHTITWIWTLYIVAVWPQCVPATSAVSETHTCQLSRISHDTHGFVLNVKVSQHRSEISCILS